MFPDLMVQVHEAAAAAANAAAPATHEGITAVSLITYGWVFAISLLGGVVNFARKVRAGETRVFRLTEFVGELATSAFAGVLAFWLCKASGLGEYVTAVIVGISGHMGSRAIFKLEQVAERWFDSRNLQNPKQ